MLRITLPSATTNRLVGAKIDKTGQDKINRECLVKIKLSSVEEKQVEIEEGIEAIGIGIKA